MVGGMEEHTTSTDKQPAHLTGSATRNYNNNNFWTAVEHLGRSAKKTVWFVRLERGQKLDRWAAIGKWAVGQLGNWAIGQV